MILCQSCLGRQLMHHFSIMYNNVVFLWACMRSCIWGWTTECQFVAVNIAVELCAEPKNASANTVILDDSAVFHSRTGSNKLHHAPQTTWYVYKRQTPVSEVVETCLHIPLKRVSCVIVKLLTRLKSWHFPKCHVWKC